MTAYAGDFALESTLDVKFTSRRFSTGAPFALASGVISAYPGNSTTQLTAGITLTADFDGVTGLNNVRVVATAANGYAAATDYMLVITTGTVDSVSVVGEVIGSFSLDNRSALRPTTAGRTLTIESDGMAHADVKEFGGTTVSAWSATRGTAGTALPAAAADAAGGLIISDAGGLDADAQLVTKINDILTDTGTTLDGRIPAALVGGRIDANLGAISSDATAADNAEAFFDGTGYAGTGNVIPTVTTLTNAPSDSSGVTTLLSRIPSGIFTGMTSLAQWLGLIAGKQTGNSTARTEIRATGAGSGAFDETTDSAEAIRDRGDAAWTTATGFSTLDAAGVRTAVGLASANLDTQLDALPTNAELATALGTADDAVLAAVAALNNLSAADINTAMVNAGLVLNSTTIATLASQTSFTLTAGSADNDAYNGCLIVITDASTATQRAVGVVLDYTGATKTVTLANDPAVFTMAAADLVDIIPCRALKPTVDNRTIDVTTSGNAGIDWNNIENPTTAQNLSATNIDVDQVVASVSGAVGSVTGAVGSVTGNVGGNVTGTIGGFTTAAKAEIEQEVDDALGSGTGAALTAIPWNAAWDTEVQSEVIDALQETVPDSVPSDGARPSVQQAAYMLAQMLTEFSISSTTLTVKKPDGSTTLFTCTLNDANSPTSLTRSG